MFNATGIVPRNIEQEGNRYANIWRCRLTTLISNSIKKNEKKTYLVKVFHKILTAYNVVFFLIYNFFVLLISNVS